MKKILIYIITAVCIVFAVQGAKAQYTDISYFMRNTPASYKMNPAHTPTAIFYINTPFSSLNFDFATSGFSYNDLITRRADDSLVVNLNNFYDKLTNKNYIKLSSNIELFGIGFQLTKKDYFSFGMDANIDANMNFSRELFGFLINGTSNANNKTEFFNNKLIYINAFISPYIAYSRVVNEKLSVGGRMKMPIGIANLKTHKSNLTVDFNNDKITATSDFLIRSSNIIGDLEFNGLGNSSDISFTRHGIGDIIKQSKKNLGLAFDLGGSYKLNDNMLVSLSIQDLGFICWSAGLTQLQSKNPNASYTFEGLGNVDFNDNNYSMEEQLDEILDSVMTSFDLEAVEGKSYTQMLPTKLYAGFTWNFANSQYLNALYKGVFGNGFSDHYLSVYYSTQLERYLNFSIGNTFAFENHFNNISALNPSLALNVNLYLINIFVGGSLRSSYNLTKITGANIFAGVNIAFGYKDYWVKNNILENDGIPEGGNRKEENIEKENKD